MLPGRNIRTPASQSTADVDTPIPASFLANTLDQINRGMQRVADFYASQDEVAQNMGKLCAPMDPLKAYSTAAGTLDPGPAFEPPGGYVFVITGINTIFGTGTTAATINVDNADPSNQLNQFSTTLLWEPKRLVIFSRHRLIWTSVGGGITVRAWGDVVAWEYLSKYLG